jgi:hypothetical protein
MTNQANEGLFRQPELDQALSGELDYLTKLARTTALTGKDRLGMPGVDEMPLEEKAAVFRAGIGATLQAIDTDRAVLMINPRSEIGFRVMSVEELRPPDSPNSLSPLYLMTGAEARCALERPDGFGVPDGHTLASLDARGKVLLNGSDLLNALKTPEDVEAYISSGNTQQNSSVYETLIVSSSAIQTYADYLTTQWQVHTASQPDAHFVDSEAYALWRALDMVAVDSGSEPLKEEIAKLRQQVIGAVAIRTLRKAVKNTEEPDRVRHPRQLASALGVRADEVLAKISGIIDSELFL